MGQTTDEMARVSKEAFKSLPSEITQQKKDQPIS